MSSAQYPTYEDPRDEGRLADLVSAGMWSTAGLVGAAMFALPGSTHAHLLEGLAVAGAAVLWGAISLVLYLTRATMSLRSRGGHRHHGAAGDRGDLGLRRRQQLPRAAAAVHLALHRLLLPAAPGVAAGGPVRRRLRHAAALRPWRDRDRLPRACAGLRGRHRRRVVRDAAAQAPPAARRGAPARDGPARPADRALQPPHLRRDARARGIPAVRASFAWAVAPADAQSAQALLDCADQRLLYRKRLNKQAI
jgi:hypothetical protein